MMKILRVLLEGEGLIVLFGGRSYDRLFLVRGEKGNHRGMEGDLARSARKGRFDSFGWFFVFCFGEKLW